MKRSKSPLNKSHSKTSPNKKNLQITTKEGGRNKKDGPFADCKLTTPTSISMLNSFLIKNADKSFDQYYNHMKKRKTQNNYSTATASQGHHG